ncbi:hyaluronidase-1-like [Bufo gargarizans]|uniref:hyaluronidase-1-like n=1 Tax=Bufo gargarizans TaxID=30331 RepID=UPI001CF31260|nr:hyaluronidase-1-like [Bufo gargarizans]
MSGSLLLVFPLLTHLLSTLAAGPAALLPARPFITVWNAPSRDCWDKYGVALDLDPFDIVVNENQSFVGSEMAIFYSSKLGLYPYYDSDGHPIHGGTPQNASLAEHLKQAYKDLNATIVSPDFEGAVVVDWENWRPLWDRNWDSKSIYQQRSRELVRQRHPHWSEEEVIREAKKEFQEAAEMFMEGTLDLGCRFRSGGLWGFYGFPSCYNYGYKNSSQNYTGECPQAEVERNNQLQWMWRSSRALYPDIYLEKLLRKSQYVGRYVRHRLGEAFRVSTQRTGGEIPVLPYARIVYTYSMDFLEQEDLIQTIGQSAALGAAGVILWGNLDYSSSKEACLALKSYIDDTLGTYVVNVSSGASLCSQVVCTRNGCCVRTDPSSEAQIHLHPSSFSIKRNPQGGGFLLSGQVTKMDIQYMTAHFQCRCYPGWSGADCSQRKVP